MTGRLIGWGLSDRPFYLVGAKVKCCKSLDYFGCRVKNYSATGLLSSSIKGRHPQPTGDLWWEEVLSLCSGAVGVFFCDTMKGVHQADDLFDCFGAKPNKGLSSRSRRDRKWASRQRSAEEQSTTVSRRKQWGKASQDELAFLVVL